MGIETAFQPIGGNLLKLVINWLGRKGLDVRIRMPISAHQRHQTVFDQIPYILRCVRLYWETIKITRVQVVISDKVE